MHYLVYKDAEGRLSRETWEKIKKDYADQDIDVSREELLADEASAYYTEAILGPTVTVDMLLGKEPSLAKKILNFFTGAARAYSKDAKLSREARRHYKRFKKLFDSFAERNKGRNAETAGAAVESGESERYSLAINAETEIDDVLKNKFHKDFVKLTDNTPPILLAQKGVKNLPLHMKPTHVRENILTEKEALAKGYRVDEHTHYHGLGKTLFLKIIEDLDNVQEAYRGTKNAEKTERRENYFILISTIKDADENIINIPIYINEKGLYHNVIVDTNKAATVFGRNNLRDYIAREVRKGNLVRIKNRSLQVGDAVALIATPYDVNASDTSISQNAKKSTDSAKKVSENFSESGKSIRKSKDVEATLAEKHREDALREFGVTSDYAKAGFVLPNGRMLKLGSESSAGVNHSNIVRVLGDIPRGKAVSAFISEGNVRVKQNGIEIPSDVPMTEGQKRALRRLISSSLAEQDSFFVDIADESGELVASVDYDGRDSAENVLWDIDNYYERGKIPVGTAASYRFSKDIEAKIAEYKKPITLKDVMSLRAIGRKSINEFTSAEIETAGKWAYKFYKEMGVKSPFFRAWFGDWRAYDKSEVKIVDTKKDNRKTIINNDTGWVIQTSKKVHKETLSHRGAPQATAVKYLPYIDDITENAILLNSEMSDKDNPNSLMFHTMYAYTEIMGYPALLKLRVEELFYYNDKESGELMRDYILQNVEEESVSERSRLSRSNHSDTNSSKISISDLFDFVKRYDKEFQPKSVNPALLNEDGTPKVFYHGTREQFTTFELQDKPKFGRALGDGFYFTPDYDKAFKFANGLFSKGQDRGGIIMPVYLRMENPYIIEKDADRTKWAKEYNAGKYDGIIDLKNDTYYVEGQGQIKSATDNIGTFDGASKDIRYSRDIEAKLSDDASVGPRMEDENGNLVPLRLEGFTDEKGQLIQEKSDDASKGVTKRLRKSDRLSPKTFERLKKDGGRVIISDELYENIVRRSDKATARKLLGRWGYSAKAEARRQKDAELLGRTFKPKESISAEDYVKEIAATEKIQSVNPSDVAGALLEIEGYKVTATILTYTFLTNLEIYVKI